MFCHSTYPHLFVQAGSGLELGSAIVLAAVGVTPHSDGGGNLDTSVGVHAPAFTPLPMGGHVALENKEIGREGKGRGGVSRVNEVLSTV